MHSFPLLAGEIINHLKQKHLSELTARYILIPMPEHGTKLNENKKPHEYHLLL